MSATQHTCVTRVHLFLFLSDTSQYQECGPVGCAIVGTLDNPPLYKLGCYNERNEYVCTANITTNNETGACIALQPGGYVSFRDEQGKSWSMQFESPNHAIEFCSHVVVAMYGASGHADRSILACDVAIGKCDRNVFANDVVKVRYQSWVVQCETEGKGLPILGSKLDGNLEDDKPCTLTIPANHMSVTPEMKGFEGMVIGMGEEGSRVIIIPARAKRGSGPSVHMCFYTHLIKKKNIPCVAQSCSSLAIPLEKHSSHQLKGESKLLLSNTQDYAIGRPNTPPPGFNMEQLMIIDRMRDQVQVLFQQLQEARRQLDVLSNDVRAFNRKSEPQSLASAQLEYSIQKLLADTEEGKELLSQKDLTLKQMEEKNKELRNKLDKFSKTANLLAEEKKSTITSFNEEKLDMDRRIAQRQAQLTRLQSEREDVARHLSTVKRLLQVADQDIKTEKQNLQMAMVAFQTNESKLLAVEETYAEEQARRKLLETKAIALGDQLRFLLEECRAKEGQMEEQRKKIESEKIRYMQLIEDERSKAAEDMRELRQEFIDELAARDRRYQEERQIVAHESFDRGRFQGIEDGQTETLLEADAATQHCALAAQRHKAEVKAIRIRLRSTKEENEADICRLTSQASTLCAALANLVGETSQMEAELDSLKSAKVSVEDDTFQELKDAIGQLSLPVGRQDLLAVLHSLRVKKDVSYAFEVQREEERQILLKEEEKEVNEWVSGVVDGIFVPFPRMRAPYATEPPVPYVPDVPFLEETEPSEEIVDSQLQDELYQREAVLQFNPDEMNRRYQELLSELTCMNPALDLTTQKNSLKSQDDASTANGLPSTEVKEVVPEDTGKPTSTEWTKNFPKSQQKEVLKEGFSLQQFSPQGRMQAFQLTQQEENDCESFVKPDLAPEKEHALSRIVSAGGGLPEIDVAEDEGTSLAVPPETSILDQRHKGSDEDIAPPQNRKLSSPVGRPTFSHSDSDSNPPVASRGSTMPRSRKLVPPKSSLFDDSDSS
ncbi:hypothetical protein TraAM80_00970 [Trypanosoma rangeli]|uniref:Uncharacterized protein n=1 Tax=Trypanosoma rangeli TaxID=5698 RepID=A0A422P0Y3_TRYRA|nr:uncharacterized protein TraAM80_00970 [Trypanosoma rangeli]RNF11334.1 hypothetical protein TraAM80_00970 [Trypanosoma rangeli]|eukprot:RNF11334.1 hypothetical protein TraAM80_00970 [Trypanosoma rangeli]